MQPVDYVLTTREFANLIRKNNIDFVNLENGEVDREGTYSGAAAIYGASGGVMESALRTGYKMITGEDMEKLDIKPVRGMKGIKKAEIQIGDKTIRVGVVATPKNFKKVLAELEEDPEAYHYIEVMMCPGGCIGGGGQPLPNTEKIIKKRIAGLYDIDKKMNLRLAHENPVVQEFFDYIKKQSHERQHEILHTSYAPKKKYE
jgi:iron only hydrogenase large subunit-like protein